MIFSIRFAPCGSPESRRSSCASLSRRNVRPAAHLHREPRVRRPERRGAVVRRERAPEFASAGELPVSLIYNGTDTLAHLPTFEAFRSAVRGQDSDDAAAAAEVELWVCINQHRSRYTRLRQAVRLLRHAALAYVAAMLLALVVNMTYGL